MCMVIVDSVLYWFIEDIVLGLGPNSINIDKWNNFIVSNVTSSNRGYHSTPTQGTELFM